MSRKPLALRGREVHSWRKRWSTRQSDPDTERFEPAHARPRRLLLATYAAAATAAGRITADRRDIS